MFKDTTILKELERLAGQLHISDATLTFRGNEYAVTPENTLQTLTGILYGECYASKESYQQGGKAKEAYDPRDNSFLTRLSDANYTSNRSEAGWKISNNYQNGYVGVTRNGQSEVVPVTALQDISAMNTLQPAQEFTVFFPKEDINRQPTFYYAFSKYHINMAQKVTRIYWNIISKGAPLLLENITKKLNHYNIPFLFKCLNHPSLFFRRDAAVLYVEDTVMPMLSLLLPGIYEEMKPYLEEDVPLFTYKYENGIGIAENPTTQESFGMNRVSAVATALLGVPYTDSTSDKIQAIAAAFMEKGINPAMPYLNKGSKILIN